MIMFLFLSGPSNIAIALSLSFRGTVAASSVGKLAWPGGWCLSSNFSWSNRRPSGSVCLRVRGVSRKRAERKVGTSRPALTPKPHEGGSGLAWPRLPASLSQGAEPPTTDLRLATSIINELLTDAKVPRAAALWYAGDRYDREHANGAGRRLHPGRGAAWRLVHDRALTV